jgi:hypothetical protein
LKWRIVYGTAHNSDKLRRSLICKGYGKASRSELNRVRSTPHAIIKSVECGGAELAHTLCAIAHSFKKNEFNITRILVTE